VDLDLDLEMGMELPMESPSGISAADSDTWAMALLTWLSRFESRVKLVLSSSCLNSEFLKSNMRLILLETDHLLV